MAHLICYDISKNSLRARLGKKILESGLDRINKSVYLGTIPERSLTRLEQELAQLMSKSDPQDSLVILPLDGRHIHRMRVYGLNELDKGELTGEKSTLIL